MSVITELKIDRKTKTERFREHVWLIDQVIIKKHGANSGVVNLVKIIIKNHTNTSKKNALKETNEKERMHRKENSSRVHAWPTRRDRAC